MSHFFALPIPRVCFVKYVLVLFLFVPEYRRGTVDRLRLGYGLSLKLANSLVINPDFILILYNCVGEAIGEVMFTCSCTVNCAFMLHLLGLICW